MFGYSARLSPGLSAAITVVATSVIHVYGLPRRGVHFRTPPTPRSNIRMHANTIFTALLALGGISSAHAAQCKHVRFDVVEVATTQGCTLGASCFVGTFDGNGWSGTNEFALDGSGAGPAASADFISYTGPFVYTTAKGQLTVRETGVYNVGAGQPQSGAVAGFQQIVGGTGEFAGATGQLFTGGRAADGVFRTHVTGQICVGAGPARHASLR